MQSTKELLAKIISDYEALKSIIDGKIAELKMMNLSSNSYNIKNNATSDIKNEIERRKQEAMSQANSLIEKAEQQAKQSLTEANRMKNNASFMTSIPGVAAKSRFVSVIEESKNGKK